MRSLISNSVLPAGHSRQCIKLYPSCLAGVSQETPESVGVLYLLAGLLELCHPAHLQYCVLCWTHLRLTPFQFASLCAFLRLRVAGCRIFDGTEVYTCSIFCLVCIAGGSRYELRGLNGCVLGGSQYDSRCLDLHSVQPLADLSVPLLRGLSP